MRILRLSVGLWLLLAAGALHATIFGNVRGIIHDPQHRPIAGGQVTIRASGSQWSATAVSADDGTFRFNALPIGTYEITASAQAFTSMTIRVAVASGSSPFLHFPLDIAHTTTSVEEPETIDTESSAARSTVSGKQIMQTPGADRANSMAMITDYVPGAYVVHDQLHVRGGHQVEWLIDGVPVPNTNIATNIGPQFDPKDISVIEAQRGGYSAEYGDRTYGVFNVVTRSGFERNNGGELIASYGSFHQTDDQISFGSHTQRFAYYASLSGNRTDLGLETPTPDVIHDMSGGLSAFGSLIWNKTPSDQLRLVTSVRGDHFQVPNTPEQQSVGIRDVEDERDDFANFTWLHSWTNALLTVSPFYHFNRAHYVGGCAAAGGDCGTTVPDSNYAAHYVGGVTTLALTKGKHNARFGLQAFGEHENTALALTSAISSLQQQDRLWGSVATLFVEDRYKPTSWLTLNGGVRLTHFTGGLSENAADPRIGAAVNLPRLKWVVRGFYGRYYQAPPLLSVSGPILDVAAQQGFGFLPLHGERDQQTEVGLSIPFAKWVAEFSYFRTNATNFLDHDVLGNSNIFFPLTLSRARIRGWEATLRSPQILGRMNLNVVYSRQTAQGNGGVTGGLTDFTPPEAGWYFLDHDQRHTLNTVIHVNLPKAVWASGTLNYGSGFLNGDGPEHLPQYTTVSLQVGKSFGDSFSVQAMALNVGNRRYLIDNSNTFGGTHWANPRELAVQVKYKFHY
jgi:outer membrane receptor for ferrienterochelin and colicin